MNLKIGESKIVIAEQEFKMRVSFEKSKPLTYAIKANSLKEAMDKAWEMVAAHEKWTGKCTGIKPL
jgi:hypothetical protein